MRLRQRLKEARQKTLKPPPRLNLVEWADGYRYVAKENSANPGRWKSSRVPVSLGPMLAVTEIDTTTITLMACTQLVKTEFLQNVAGYFIHQDPASILFIQPTQKLAEGFSKERFSKTVDNTPVLKERIPEARSRDSETTIAHKPYPGGALHFVGANSPVDLASRPKRITLADEIDLYPADAGGMGDPLALGEERSSTFKKRRKNIRACSPSDEATSRINREYVSSDQRKCFVRCPHCGHEQTLTWSRQTIVWEKDEDGNHLPETANYICKGCGTAWTEADRRAALNALAVMKEPHKGWKQTRKFKCCGKEHDPNTWEIEQYNGWDEKGRSHCPECGKVSRYEGHAGFNVSKLYSTRHDLSDVVREYLDSYLFPPKLKKWTNTALAQVTKEEVETLDPDGLKKRREPYSWKAIPEGVKMLFVGADTQDYRLEMTILGFGLDGEIWVIRHIVLNGDTSQKQVWDDFDRELKKTYYREDGKPLKIQATCIDSQGHRAQTVYSFCHLRRYRRVYATKGMGNKKSERMIWPSTPSRTKKSSHLVYIIGVDTAKDQIAGQLAILPNMDGSPKPYSIHFPDDGLSEDYFEQLTSEEARIVTSGGQKIRQWALKVDGTRNEAWDCLVLGLAARLSHPARLQSKGKIKARLMASTSNPAPDEPAPEAAPTDKSKRPALPRPNMKPPKRAATPKPVSKAPAKQNKGGFNKRYQ